MNGTETENMQQYNPVPGSSSLSAAISHSYDNTVSDQIISMNTVRSANMNVNNNDQTPSPFALRSQSENNIQCSPLSSSVTPSQTEHHRQHSPASSGGLDGYQVHVNSPMDSMLHNRNEILQSSPLNMRDRPMDIGQLSPSNASTVSSTNQNDTVLNSPAAVSSSKSDPIPNSPSNMTSQAGSTGDHISTYPNANNMNPTPQLPPYSGGYFQNILASYHGYRSNMAAQQSSPELDKATAENIANIAKSVVQGTPMSSGEGRKVRDKPFQCTLCHKRYTNRAGLTVHILSHTGERPHACTLCDKRFTQKGALDQHMLIHTGQRPFECKVCFKTFTQKANLNSHMMIHSGEKPFQCRICDKRFTQRSNLNTHILTHSDLEKMQAVAAMGGASDVTSQSLPFPIGPTHSNESFQKYNPNLIGAPRSEENHRHSIDFLKSQFDLNVRNNLDESSKFDRNTTDRDKFDKEFDHIKPTIDNNNPPFSPPPPQPPTSQDPNTSPRFKADDMSHPNPPTMNPFQNDTFQNILANIRNSFVGNVRSHSKPSDNKERPFQCMFCEKRFTQRAGLNAHVLIHSGQRPHPCSLCDKRFTQKSGLDQHMLTHTGERPHQCHLCDKRFTQKANLNHHILTHTGEKRHVCPFCERRFTQKANLNAHILTHTGEKRMVCPFCDRRFSQKANLNAHILTHTGEKPHQCMVCERRFTQKSGLNQHILTHTGEKPYHCKLCDKAYTQKSGLDVHMYSHSGQKPYRCQFCDKQFVARTLWAKHLRSSHGHEEPPPMNAYGRGGHGGMNLIPMLKNAPDLFKQPPSDCFKLLHDSYSNGGQKHVLMGDNERSNFARSQSLDESGYEISKNGNMKIGPGFARRESTPAMKVNTSGVASSISGSMSPRASDDYPHSENEDIADAITSQSGNSFKQPMENSFRSSANNYGASSASKPAQSGFREPMSPGTMLQTLKAQYSERFKQGNSQDDLAEKYGRNESGYKASSGFDVFAEQSNARSNSNYEGSDVFSENTDQRSGSNVYKSMADRNLQSLREQYAKNRSRSVDNYTKLDLNRYGVNNQDHSTSTSQNGYKSSMDVDSSNQQTSTSQSANQQQGEGQFKLPPALGAEPLGLNDGSASAAMFGNRMGNMYQERFMNIYRDMMSTSYPQDAPPAFT